MGRPDFIGTSKGQKYIDYHFTKIRSSIIIDDMKKLNTLG